MVRFLHAADIHLGYSQYGEKERYNDFARAYLGMVNAAIAEGVDFVVLAGDLFHERDVDPRTLLQAVRGLVKLRDAGIPVLAIEGNHERPHWHDAVSWLDYLAQMVLLKDLTPWHEDERMVLAPWDEGKRAGAFIDLPCGVRVYGSRYMGASTAKVVEQLAAQMAAQPRAVFSLLMLHAGIDGVLPHFGGGLTHAQLAPLRPFVDYIALGHIHMPFEHGDWLYNPGSLESNSMEEVAWPKRGYYLVEVDMAAHSHRARLIPGKRRAFVRLQCDVTAMQTPEQLENEVGAFLTAQAGRHREPEPVVELTLTGALAFGAAGLPLESLRLQAQGLFNALLVRVQNHAVPPGWEIADVEHASRAELERDVLRQLVERDEWRRANSDSWLKAAVQLKEMALGRQGAAQIITQVHDLVGQLAEERA